MDSQIYILNRIVDKFCKDFLNELTDVKSILGKFGINDIEESLPSPFKGKEKIKIVAYYSLDKKQLFVMFNESENDSFSFFSVMGDPIPGNIVCFEESGLGCSAFQSLRLGDLYIEYAFIITIEEFIYRLNNLREFTINFINAFNDLYKYNKKSQNESYLNNLENLKQQMSELFFDESVLELRIDNFLEKNPIILHKALHLENFNHQVLLKNLLNKYEHDLKPDLIAFDTLNKNWVIVDYKRAKRSIIKNLSKVRTGFTSHVNNLRDQLRDYKEYFEEKEHREYVNITYNIDILDPDAIGIIGNISVQEQNAFTHLMKDQPRWFKVVPYNYLYDNFCKYVDTVKEIKRM